MFKLRKEQKEAFAGAFGVAVTPCSMCLIVRIVEIKGLYAGGVDDRKNPAEDTTKGASYVPGYASLDDKGRIFINRDVNGAWKRDTHGIEITVRVDPPSVPIPPGTQIEWTFSDPDDPSNEDPRMHRSAGKLLDPNDYASGRKIGEKRDDNNPNGKPAARPGFAQVDARYLLSGNKTLVNPANRLSKVRFNVSDIAGDNYQVQANITPRKPITTTIGAVTGIMTVWNRIDVEYVKMASADELPVSQLPIHFSKAYAQVDITLKRVVSGAGDMPFMGDDEKKADAACDKYASKSGQFTMEGKPGWFFVAAANRHQPEKDAWVIHEGDAFAHNNFIRLPKGTFLPDTPKIARVFNPQKVKGLVKPWPQNPEWFTVFYVNRPVFHQGSWWLELEPHDFHEVDKPLTSFFDAFLGHYGFFEGATISVQIVTAGEGSSYPLGQSPGGLDKNGHHYFAGKVIVFTKGLEPERRIITLCHELCHAFDNAHKCGNWDWTNGPTRQSCCMTYRRAFVLGDAKPRAPIRWTQYRRSAEFCAQHLRHMRDYHLQDNPGLGWK